MSRDATELDGATGLDGVTVEFAGVPALDGVTLLAGPGEVLAVIGPSGCGKTTLLRTVAGLERAVDGRILVAGRDVTGIPTAQRNVAMVFQSTTLAPFLTVAANLERSAKGWGAGADDGAEDRVADRGRRLGLGRLLPRMPRTLSPGERGRVGIGRAVVRRPDAFLFDEPLAHLDAVERTRTRRTIVELVRDAGVGALYVTHDQAEAMAVGDRLAVLNEGRLLQVDRARRIYERPADVFVARFVGEPEIGLLPARAVAGADGSGFRVGSRILPLWGPLPDGVRDGSPVVLGLRPEHLRLAGPGADPAEVVVPVVVSEVVRPGPEAVVVGEVAVAGDADGARLSVRVNAGTALQTGERVELLVDARRAHVFDAVTGRALAHPDP
jgi:multiple sugar transport system ATP-binding protein